MLSRIAESLFWIGRYMERAEDTARALEVHLQELVEDPTVDEASSAARLLTVMGVDLPDGQGGVDGSRVLRLLCFDQASGCSIVATLAGARESARRARETVSMEMWEGINTTYHDVMGSRWVNMRPLSALRLVLERCAVVSGLADHTMTHDEGWYFLMLGRSIERVDMAARMVSLAAMDPDSPVAWGNALRSCGAYHAFVRSYGGENSNQQAAQFLLLDRLFPRSVVHTLSLAEDALVGLDASDGRSSLPNAAELVVGRARSNLEYRPIDDLMNNLDARMNQLQLACAEASAAISKLYFEGAIADAWQGGEW